MKCNVNNANIKYTSCYSKICRTFPTYFHKRLNQFLSISFLFICFIFSTESAQSDRTKKKNQFYFYSLQ